MSKRPDSFSEDANILPYGSNISAPQIVIPDVDTFKNERGVNAANYFKGRIDALQKEYDEIVRLAKETELVYNARYNFIPRVGTVYHLYWTGTDHILSMIENWDRFEFVGSFVFTADNVWQKVFEKT